MRSNRLTSILRPGLAAGLMLLGVSGASAWERLGFASYGGYASYAGPSVHTVPHGFVGHSVPAGYDGYGLVPRSVNLVPPAWGYGAYGVPSATGIRQAPTARPTVYVIDRPTARRRQGGDPRILSRNPNAGWSDADGSEVVSGGARIVTVPHR